MYKYVPIIVGCFIKTNYKELCIRCTFKASREECTMADNTSNIGFEKQIWDAACVLRGNIDASEYKSVVLGLIFLKYISDRFEAKYKELERVHTKRESQIKAKKMNEQKIISSLS